MKKRNILTGALSTATMYLVHVCVYYVSMFILAGQGHKKESLNLADVSVILLFILVPFVFFRLTWRPETLRTVALYMGIIVLLLTFLLMLSGNDTNFYLVEAIYEFTFGLFPLAISLYNKFFANIFFRPKQHCSDNFLCSYEYHIPANSSVYLFVIEKDTQKKYLEHEE